MLNLKYIFRVLKLFFIFSVITSCAVNDKEAFNIIDEAKKIFLNIPKEDEINKRQTEQEKEDKEKKNKASEIVIKKRENQLAEDTEIVKQEKYEEKNIEQEESKFIVREKKDIFPKEDNKKLGTQSEPYISEKILKVGVLLPLTGEHKDIGNLILNALELALFQTDNKKIKLVIRDTKADAQTTQKVFKDFIDSNIKVFIGPLYSKSLVSIEGYVSKKELKVFALTNNTNLAKRGVWTFGIDPQQQTKTILDHIISSGNKNIGFLLPDNAYGYLLYDTIEKVLNRNDLLPSRVEFFKEDIESQRVAAKKISRGFDKYEEYLKELEENLKDNELNEPLLDSEVLKKPLDSIFIGASGQTLTILASQLQYSNVDPNKVSYVGISSWEDISILQEPALKGGLFATTTDFLQDDIKKTYSIVYGSEIPKVAMVAYDILSLLNATLRENGKVEIKYLLNENGYLGLRGLFRLKLDGTVERTFQIKKIRKEKFVVHKAAAKNFEN